MANEIQIHSNGNEKRKLSHNVVKTAKPALKTRFIRDTEIPGFALRIEPTGAMSWAYQFRYKANDDRNGKTRLYTFGSCNPPVLPKTSKALARKQVRLGSTFEITTSTPLAVLLMRAVRVCRPKAVKAP